MTEAPRRAVSVFLAAVAGRHPEAPTDSALAPLVDGLLEAGRAAWPGLAVDEDAFLTFVSDRLPKAPTLPEAIARVRAGDLYLACACARGDSAAIQRFDVHYFADLDAIAKRFKSVVSSADDVRQIPP